MIDLAPNNPYSLELATLIVAAAGSLGYGVEVARQLGLAQRDAAHGLGAIVTRTTTLHSRRGHPPPALHEAPAGLIYSGLDQNPGRRTVIERFAPAWAAWTPRVILSVAATDPDELAALVGDLDLVEGVAGVELSLRLCGATTAAEAGPLVAAARAATPLPLVVRLPGLAPDLVGLAEAAAAAGADALSLVDGLPARTPDRAEGLLCGPAIRPLALAAVAAVCAAVELPVIGGGGVGRPEDARALLEAGASAVALGSALVIDLRAAARVAAGL